MESIPEQNIFSRIIEVLPEHLDDLQHVNNVVYLQYLQEIANQHWCFVMGEAADKTGYWVVRRHEIDYLAPALLGDQLEIRTWTGKHTASSWERHYRIVRVGDQKTLVNAGSIWVWIDAVTHRPCRIDPAVIRLFQS
jgi:acyl-CoA thioester hydrolase